ncbi:hypothetical protein QTN25_010644 [Entamoeba marina]
MPKQRRKPIQQTKPTTITWLHHYIEVSPHVNAIKQRLGLTDEELEISIESLVDMCPDDLTLQTQLFEVYGDASFDFYLRYCYECNSNFDKKSI